MFIKQRVKIQLSVFLLKIEGALETLDTNNYYPFGLNHKGGNGLNSSGFGSWQSYKYNGKELQETGMYDYGARMYMADLGRWGVVDPLAEASTRFSTYAYGLNNPVMFIDPDGRKAIGHELQAMESEYNSFLRNQGGGAMSQMLSGGGRLNTSYYPGNLGGSPMKYTTFGQTQAYSDIMNAAANDGTAELTNTNGTIKWWTDYDDPDAGVNGVGQLNILKLASGSSSAGISGNVSSMMWWTNTAVGAFSAYTVYKGQYHLSNELWRYQQYGKNKIITPWTKMKNGKNYWNNPFAKAARLNQLEKVKNVRNISSKLTKVGGVLLAADIVLSGEIKPSHIINGAMLGASTTGVGAIVAGAWFIADFGTLGANYLINGEAKGLGDMLDESIGTYEMYDGLY